MIPGIVYGGGKEATAISLDATKFDHMLKTSHAGLNTLIDLEGDSEASGRTVIAKELQREPIRGAIVHGDFFEINLREKIHVSVPVHLTGEPVGVSISGGILDQQLREIDCICLPNAIPDEIEADVTGLDLGDSLHISDLVVPDGVEIETDATSTIATIIVPRGLKEGEGEVAAPEEGEVAEGAEGAEASAEKSDES